MRLFEKYSQGELQNILSGHYNVIGVDFGDGESTAAICNKQGTKSLDVDAAEHKKMVTALYMSSDGGDVRIGENAINILNTELIKKKGSFYVNFKCKPEDAECCAEMMESAITRRTKREVMRSFFHAFVTNLFAVNEYGGSQYLDPNKETILLIGRPAGSRWEGKTEQEYKKMLCEGFTIGGKKPKDIFVVSESMAALAQCVSSQMDNIKFDDKVVCIDVGSSTLDITCVQKGAVAKDSFGKPHEYGIALGAGMLEHKMLERACTLFSQGPKKISPANITNAKIVYTARTCKENFFGDVGKDGYPTEMSIPYVMNPATDSPLDVSIFTQEVDTDFMKDVTHHMPVRYASKEGVRKSDSWAIACEEFFREVAKKVNVGGTVNHVILTGGGSKMPFVKEAAQRVFGERSVVSSREASYTVARGLAWMARKEAQTEMALRQIIEFIPQCQGFSVDSFSETYVKILVCLAELLMNEVMIPELDRWKDKPDEIPFVMDLADRINQKCASLLARRVYSKDLRTIVKGWAKENAPSVIKEINEKLSKLFGIQIPQTYQLPLSNTLFEGIDGAATEVKIDMQADKFLNKLMGSFGAGLVAMTYKHTLEERKRLYDNVMTVYPNGIIYGFNALFGFTHVDGLVVRINEQLGSEKFYKDIIDEITKALHDEISEMINTMAMYSYSKNA